MINRILELMSANNVKASQLTSELKLSNSAITDWKKGKAKPSLEAICKIAAYFNVSIEYLVNGNENVSETDTIKSSASLSDTEQRLLAYFKLLSVPQQFELLGELKEKTKKVEINKKDVV